MACRALLHGSIGQIAAADALITPLLDRPLAEISPIERGVLWIGVYELQHCPDVPWRVVLNECIELAKSFGMESLEKLKEDIAKERIHDFPADII